MALTSGAVDTSPLHSPMIAWNDGFRRLLLGISRHAWKLVPGVAP
jgi:hypothetical protein